MSKKSSQSLKSTKSSRSRSRIPKSHGAPKPYKLESKHSARGFTFEHPKRLLGKPTKAKLLQLAALCPITKYLRTKPYADCVSEQNELKSHVNGPQRVSEQIYSAADTSMASSFVSLNKVYRFRLGGYSGVNQTTGVINTFFSCDPSAAGTNFPEWTTLTSLFSEFKLVEYGVQMVGDLWAAGALGTASAITSCVVAGNLGTSVAPGSVTAVVDNADSKYVQFGKDTSTKGYTHIIRSTEIGWSQVTTPTVTPYAGAPGCIQIYGNFGSISQSNALRCLIWGIYDFRSRI